MVNTLQNPAAPADAQMVQPLLFNKSIAVVGGLWCRRLERGRPA